MYEIQKREDQICWKRSGFQIVGKGTKTQNRKQGEIRDKVYSEMITYQLVQNFRIFVFLSIDMKTKTKQTYNLTVVLDSSKPNLLH